MKKILISLALLSQTLVAEDAIWGTDGSYQGYTQDNGSYRSIWGVDGSYHGRIDKDWVNPHLPKIDRGRE